MNALTTRSIWVRLRPLAVGGAFVAGSVAFAEEPAARLLPIKAIDPPVVRASAPPVQPPTPQPPAPQYRGPEAAPAPAAKPTGTASLFGGPAKPTPSPTAPPAPPAPPPGVYAGPPAFKWYGYGGVQPGTNSYAPTGRYPQGSGGWYTQTGATPGAFPVPVGGVPVHQAEPPVVTVTGPQEMLRPATSRPTPTPTPTYAAPSPIRRIEDWPEPPQTRPVLAEANPARPQPQYQPQQQPVATEPAMPSGGGVLASSTTLASNTTLPSSKPTDLDPQVNWGPSVQPTERTPIAASPPAGVPQPMPASVPQPMPAPEPTPQHTGWSPAKKETPPPTVTVSRGQVPEAKASVADLIRSACFGRASRVGVELIGQQRVHVRLVAPTEQDARDAAAVVSRLPELKAWTVTFEAAIGK